MLILSAEGARKGEEWDGCVGANVKSLWMRGG